LSTQQIIFEISVMVFMLSGFALMAVILTPFADAYLKRKKRKECAK
tara:strand:- start:245 stop:382 length:138 start_codon:yes stop_codon:yes gene_type:complete